MQALVYSLLNNARAWPERTAFIVGRQGISYRDFERMISAVAARLRDRQVGRGDRVLLCGPNSAQLAAAYFAVHSVGGIAVMLDADAPPETARRIVDDCRPRLTLSAVDLDLPVTGEELLDFARPERGQAPVEPVCRSEDVADILYTTGTTGRRKGVVLEHRHVAQAATNINAFVGSRSNDVELVPIPLTHSFGLGRLRCMALVGNTLALEAGMPNPARTLKRLLELKVSGFSMVPAGFELILRMTRDRLGDARGHLRYIEIGSAAMRLQTKHKLMELLPETRICHHFGLTEASRSAFIEYHADRDRLDSIGRASPNVEISVCDERGRVLAPGEQGELMVQGGMVMQEYWKLPELSRQTLDGRRLHTGDWGYKDADGYLYLIGRRKDLINVGGLKVAPREVERQLNAHPRISDSACVAMPDPGEITGEAVKAFTVSDADVPRKELVAWLRERLEEYKIPRQFERVDRIERTSSGKIRYHRLRKEDTIGEP